MPNKEVDLDLLDSGERDRQTDTVKLAFVERLGLAWNFILIILFSTVTL